MRQRHSILSKRFAKAAVLSLSAVLGCGQIFYLPGHNEANMAAPPDITMHVGERRKVLSNGLNPLDVPPAAEGIRSDDPAIVSVEGPDKDNAYLKANTAGVTRVHYLLTATEEENRGFTVTVFPPKGS